MMVNNMVSLNFLKSALSFRNPFISTQDVLTWIKEQNEKVKVNVDRIPFAELERWQFDDNTGSLRHETGKFFSIRGLHVETSWGNVPKWEQPIINQPEIGYLGFITKEFEGVLYFLMQAKTEPGNINHVQLSPTLQATRSNYTRVHDGAAPAYLEYFQQAKPGQVLVDQLQSEQGARFLRKRNRNIIIQIDESIEVLDNFIWLTLGQIRALMAHDNIISMDSRTVLSGLPYGNYALPMLDLVCFLEQKQGVIETENKILKSTLSREGAYHSFNEVINFITRTKCQHTLEITEIPIRHVMHWNVGTHAVDHDESKYFRVIAVRVEIDNREVLTWTQPMVEPVQEGLCAFVAKEINGLLHFAVQAKLECGNLDIIELAPTVQCLTGDYRSDESRNVPFLECVLNAPPESLLVDTQQSEEGGRFFRESNRNVVVLAGDEIPIELPKNHIWMTLGQLQTFIKFNNYLNIQARSLVAALPFSHEVVE